MYVDVAEESTAEVVQDVSGRAYEAVVAILDPNVYFSQGNDMKMYDLEIHTSNMKDGRDKDNFIYGIFTKTIRNECPHRYQLVSSPKNPEIASEFKRCSRS